ncbi:non-oxidative hydroxyarylic acid decarboxylases subunit D [Streptomyces sp. NPDC051956]|uniref:non-oxidative hydroxyarylic acid decarboxylases subunit D n=1 Tax=Streptomyces sp. NPDC051956 TaxID=3365677 RepID=UPI0037D8A59D
MGDHPSKDCCGDQHASVRPRCNTDTVRVLTTSPVPDRWVMYVCDTCIYSWRSTGPDQATNPATYAAAFKIDPGRDPHDDSHPAPTTPPTALKRRNTPAMHPGATGRCRHRTSAP